MVLQTIIKPVFFACEADKYPGWFSVPRDHNLFGFSEV